MYQQKPNQFNPIQLEKFYKTDFYLGLEDNEVAIRLRRHGKNIIKPIYQETFFITFLNQFKNPLIYLLLSAAGIIFFLGNGQDAFIISGVLLFNAAIGTIQERRSRNIFLGLKKFISENTVVVRDGFKMIVDSQELVIGDIILIQAGELMPADGIVIENNDFFVDEAILTGESIPVQKIAFNADNDQNLAFKGCQVLKGNAKIVITNTGNETKIGKIQKLTQEIDTEFPLKQELEKLSNWILLFIVVICLSLLLIGLNMGKTFCELLVMLTALFICVVPEGLPVVLTLILVNGAYNLALKSVLVKHLQSIDGLGRLQTLIIDKTGTLTKNEVMVEKFYYHKKIFGASGDGYIPKGEITTEGNIVAIDKKFRMLSDSLFILNSSCIAFDKDNIPQIKGDPTEIALYILGLKMGGSQDQANESYNKIAEIPFNTPMGIHFVLCQNLQEHEYIIFACSSPEKIALLIDENTRQEILSEFLQEGLRTVCVAYLNLKISEIPKDLSTFDFKNWITSNTSKFKLLSILGLQDAVRTDAQEMVRKVKDAGVQVIMATGDHAATALFVAKKTGIAQDKTQILQGFEFDKISDEQMVSELEKYKVYARFSTENKLRLVYLFKKQNRIVGMAGDGVNDAPAIAAADLGIAMGQFGTEVAKEAADIILLKNSFSSIVAGIEEGRHIFYTLRRVVIYFFATNFGEIFVVLFAFCLRLDIPILAAQILWLNLVTDGFLDIALSMEPMEKNILNKTINTDIIDFNAILRIIYMAIPMGVGSVFLFYKYQAIDIAKARTMTLISMAMFQWYNAWNCRSENRSLFDIGLFTNKWLVITTLLVLILQILVVNVGFLQKIFSTVPLNLLDWLIIFVISSSIILIEEIRKKIDEFK